MYKLDLDKLAKFLGMMESAHDGEALNAARMAVKMVRGAQATWPEVLKHEPEPKRYPTHSNGWDPEPEDDHRPVAEMILDWSKTRGLFLFEREPDFLNTVRNWDGPLTDAQQRWFDKIVLRARRNGFPV